MPSTCLYSNTSIGCGSRTDRHCEECGGATPATEAEDYRAAHRQPFRREKLVHQLVSAVRSIPAGHLFSFVLPMCMAQLLSIVADMPRSRWCVPGTSTSTCNGSVWPWKPLGSPLSSAAKNEMVLRYVFIRGRIVGSGKCTVSYLTEPAANRA